MTESDTPADPKPVESKPAKKRLRSAVWTTLAIAIPMLLIGVAAFVYMIRTPKKPSGLIESIPPRVVRVIRAEQGSHRIALSAYGTTRADRDWTVIAEVAARVVAIDSRFEAGEILPADTVLIQLDPTDYDLALDQLMAKVRSQQQQVLELNANEANLKKIAALQTRQTKLAQAERDRELTLSKQDFLSQSSLDAVENTLITRQTAEQQTQNELALIPVRRDLLQAERDATQAELSQAKRRREKCEIRVPFDARCTSKSIEVDQLVALGERLGRFLAMEKTEVVVMLETGKIPGLFPRGIPELGTLDLANPSDGKSPLQRIQMPAVVEWQLGSKRHRWNGRVTRLGSSLDPATQTVPLILEVLDPYKNVIPGVRPPLVPDIFCKVTLFGDTVDYVTVIPRSALREISANNGNAPRDDRPKKNPRPQNRNRTRYVVHRLEEGKLSIVEVEILVIEEDRVVISKGLDADDQIVLTDIFPAVAGMPLEAWTPPNGSTPQPSLLRTEAVP